jgi:chromosome partitioning protein
MNTTLVINGKGGVGKTTITTNLASYFASRSIPTAIADCDPQGSSLNWLEQRPADAFKLHGVDLSRRVGSGRRQVPRDTRHLIIDAPAGPSRLLLQDLLARTRSILIPIAPSSIDVHATAAFIKELLLVGQVRFRNLRVAVIANRVRSGKPIYAPLERFLAALQISILSKVSDSDVYVDAAERGIGVFEMPESEADAERAELLPICQWVQGVEVAAGSQASNVVSLSAARALASAK